MLNNALLIQIQANIDSGDICKITFDKYLIGKLLDHISDGNLFFIIHFFLYIYMFIKKLQLLSIFTVIITKNYILCTYNDNQITIVHFTRSKRHVFDKINKLEPKLSTIDLFGPNGRRLDKKVQTNKCGDLVIIFIIFYIYLYFKLK